MFEHNNNEENERYTNEDRYNEAVHTIIKEGVVFGEHLDNRVRKAIFERTPSCFVSPDTFKSIGWVDDELGFFSISGLTDLPEFDVRASITLRTTDGAAGVVEQAFKDQGFKVERKETTIRVKIELSAEEMLDELDDLAVPF